MHKVGIVDIFVQLLVEVIENSWETNQFQCKQTFVMVLWIQMEGMDFSILLIFKFTQYKNPNDANFVYCGKTLKRKTLYICDLQTTHPVFNAENLL